MLFKIPIFKTSPLVMAFLCSSNMTSTKQMAFPLLGSKKAEGCVIYVPADCVHESG